MGKYILISFCGLFILACSGTFPIEPNEDLISNIKQVSLNLDQQYILELDLHACSGFQWDYFFNNTNVVRIDSIKYFPEKENSDSLTVGGMTKEVFYFSAINNGQCDITLIEHRIWEKNVAPLNSLKVCFFVK